ncbi:3-deoxy-D-manno-octulosonic acid transferase [Terriglobus saanensis]|uniref:3-deoxy-D-manno-octulosonic acid transferase n=1 Tax=Terriglobus saanensis (strain ATCC BAA-1853 / DSM 23119 / SP1PR4) TaxID=401053 RepID=E8V1D8_TERSS|nr:glycosyltransferase N-terminal domain-containing protein [Terriglobus saanensis]ADV84553.1 Three-deoxy-D-manno-octulosonic-acid transferase domain-containing protein [Terriglobus saanensis SP1PR4]
MMWLYSLGLSLALVVSAPWWALRMLTSGRYREGLGERLGFVPARLRVQPKVVWLHAVSVGEVLAAGRLIAAIEESGLRVALSTTTAAGQKLAREKYGAERVFYFPLDFAFAVRAYLRALRPCALVLMESELWPRVLVECERAKVSVVVVNGRVSDRSFPRYMKLSRLWKPLLGKVRLILTQSQEDAWRWRMIGSQWVETTGNLKYDVRVEEESALVRALRVALPTEQTRVLVCGSTLEGEESLLLECWRGQDAVMVLAPRHPQRFDAVAKLVESRGLRCIRLSSWRKESAGLPGASLPHPLRDEAAQRMGHETLHGGDVLLLDSIGDLAAMYALGDAAFVGGSLVPMGGHNPLEAAQWGVPVMMGEYYANFRGMVDAMLEEDAVRIVSAEELCAEITRLLWGDDEGVGLRGKEFFESQAGATKRVMERLLPILRAGVKV